MTYCELVDLWLHALNRHPNAYNCYMLGTDRYIRRTYHSENLAVKYMAEIYADWINGEKYTTQPKELTYETMEQIFKEQT